MALTANINLNVPALPDVGIAFVNAAAWNTYWSAVGGVVTLNPANTNLYVPIVYDNTNPPYELIVNGVPHVLVTVAMFQSLLNEVQALDNAFQDMRTQLKTAGLITQAQ